MLTWSFSYGAQALKAWAFIISTALQGCHIKVPPAHTPYVRLLTAVDKPMLVL